MVSRFCIGLALSVGMYMGALAQTLEGPSVCVPPTNSNQNLNNILAVAADAQDPLARLRYQLDHISEVVQKIYEAEQRRQQKTLIFIDQKKTWELFSKKESSVTQAELEEAMNEQVELQVVNGLVEDILSAGGFKEGSKELERKAFPGELFSAQAMQYFQRESSPNAFMEFKRIPVILLKKIEMREGASSREAGGMQLSSQSLDPILADDSIETVDIIENGKKKADVDVVFKADVIAKVFRQVIADIFGSASIIILPSFTVSSLEDRIGSLSQKWALVEESVHAIQAIDDQSIADTRYKEMEKEYLTSVVKEKTAEWFKSDVARVLNHPKVDSYIEFLKNQASSNEAEDSAKPKNTAKPPSVEEIKKTIPGILEEDYPRNYSEFWPYFTSEVELQAKWKTVQYLKHIEKASFDEILQTLTLMNENQSELENNLVELSKRARNLYFVHISGTEESYYRALYDSDHESPLHRLNTFAKALSEIRGEGITDRAKIREELSKRLHFKFEGSDSGSAPK